MVRFSYNEFSGTISDNFVIIFIIILYIYFTMLGITLSNLSDCTTQDDIDSQDQIVNV